MCTKFGCVNEKCTTVDITSTAPSCSGLNDKTTCLEKRRWGCVGTKCAEVKESSDAVTCTGQNDTKSCVFFGCLGMKCKPLPIDTAWLYDSTCKGADGKADSQQCKKFGCKLKMCSEVPINSEAVDCDGIGKNDKCTKWGCFAKRCVRVDVNSKAAPCDGLGRDDQCVKLVCQGTKCIEGLPESKGEDCAGTDNEPDASKCSFYGCTQNMKCQLFPISLQWTSKVPCEDENGNPDAQQCKRWACKNKKCQEVPITDQKSKGCDGEGADEGCFKWGCANKKCTQVDVNSKAVNCTGEDDTDSCIKFVCQGQKCIEGTPESNGPECKGDNGQADASKCWFFGCTSKAPFQCKPFPISLVWNINSCQVDQNGIRSPDASKCTKFGCVNKKCQEVTIDSTATPCDAVGDDSQCFKLGCVGKKCQEVDINSKAPDCDDGNGNADASKCVKYVCQGQQCIEGTLDSKGKDCIGDNGQADSSKCWFFGCTSKKPFQCKPFPISLVWNINSCQEEQNGIRLAKPEKCTKFGCVNKKCQEVAIDSTASKCDEGDDSPCFKWGCYDKKCTKVDLDSKAPECGGEGQDDNCIKFVCQGQKCIEGNYLSKGPECKGDNGQADASKCWFFGCTSKKPFQCKPFPISLVWNLNSCQVEQNGIRSPDASKCTKFGCVNKKCQEVAIDSTATPCDGEGADEQCFKYVCKGQQCVEGDPDSNSPECKGDNGQADASKCWFFGCTTKKPFQCKPFPINLVWNISSCQEEQNGIRLAKPEKCTKFGCVNKKCQEVAVGSDATPCDGVGQDDKCVKYVCGGKDNMQCIEGDLDAKGTECKGDNGQADASKCWFFGCTDKKPFQCKPFPLDSVGIKSCQKEINGMRLAEPDKCVKYVCGGKDNMTCVEVDPNVSEGTDCMDSNGQPNSSNCWFFGCTTKKPFQCKPFPIDQALSINSCQKEVNGIRSPVPTKCIRYGCVNKKCTEVAKDNTSAPDCDGIGKDDKCVKYVCQYKTCTELAVDSKITGKPCKDVNGNADSSKCWFYGCANDSCESLPISVESHYTPCADKNGNPVESKCKTESSESGTEQFYCQGTCSGCEDKGSDDCPVYNGCSWNFSSNQCQGVSCLGWDQNSCEASCPSGCTWSAQSSFENFLRKVFPAGLFNIFK
jgi:hypothetical protein